MKPRAGRAAKYGDLSFFKATKMPTTISNPFQFLPARQISIPEKIAEQISKFNHTFSGDDAI
jgi:hypothetical protein